jgi:HKD family nuclease
MDSPIKGLRSDYKALFDITAHVTLIQEENHSVRVVNAATDN